MAEHSPTSRPTHAPRTALQSALRLGGAAIGAQLYAVHVLVNTVTDAAIHGRYDASTCRTLLAEQDALLQTLRLVATELAHQASLPASEKRFLGKANDAFAVVLGLIGAAHRVVHHPEEGQARQAFARHRTESLAAVRGLLGGAP